MSRRKVSSTLPPGAQTGLSVPVSRSYGCWMQAVVLLCPGNLCDTGVEGLPRNEPEPSSSNASVGTCPGTTKVSFPTCSSTKAATSVSGMTAQRGRQCGLRHRQSGRAHWRSATCRLSTQSLARPRGGCQRVKLDTVRTIVNVRQEAGLASEVAQV